MDRIRLIIGAFFVTAIAVGWVCFDERLSRLGDNAEFIDISKGLVTGHGMAFVHGPEPEPARKFPPGYPVILAVVQLISPDDINLMKAVSVLFFAFLVPLVFLLIRELEDEPVALLIAGCALLSPHLIEFSHQVLSEIPYAAISTAGLLALVRHRDAVEPKQLAVLVLLAVAAYYVRTIGLTAIGAVVLTAFLDRRYKHGFLMGCAAAVAILPWVLQSSAYLDQFSSVNPYQTDESALVSLGVIADRIAENLNRYGLQFLPVAFAPVSRFEAPLGWAETAVALLVDALLLWFLVFSVRRSSRVAPVGIYLVLYLVVVLLWPEVWADTRFVVPIIPLVAYAMVWSARDICLRLPASASVRRAVPYAVAVVLLVANGVHAARTQVYHEPYHPGWADYFASAEWIRDNTPEDALIVCRKPFLMNVISGRKTMSYPWIEPEPLVKSLTESGADYVVRDVVFGSSLAVLNPAIARYPQSFLPLRSYPESGTAIFEFLGYAEKLDVATLEERVAWLDRSIERSPNDRELWMQLYAIGTMLHQAGQLDRAQQIYERIIPVLGEEANVHQNLAILHYSQNRFKDALIAFAAAANRDPQDHEPRLGLAQTYEQVGNFEKASEEAKEAYRRNAQSVVALHLIARTAVKLDRKEEAETAFNEAVRLQPGALGVRNDLAFFYLNEGRYEDARRVLSKLIEEVPGQAEFRLNIVTALVKLGRLAEAKPHLDVLLTEMAAEITSGPIADVTRDVLNAYAEATGTTAEALIENARR